ncbi:hypothetical protein EMPS_06571 [Entomortierella parvispora]|uniref:Methyltransferase domain-containing protein n=1 Tax=Entomortierella parvispora TaxID=205924 RepID=A0A9P3LXK8_9FUNG|nr:hypothetical protein EMPS_06571 [Entomortierella parvispora]
MFEHADYAQAFSYNGTVRKLEVIRPATAPGSEDRDFVLLEDVADHFGIAHLSNVYFERQDGLSLSFARDRNLRRHVPERIPACKGAVIYIIPRDHAGSNAASPSPSTSSSCRAPAMTTIDQAQLGADVNPTKELESDQNAAKRRQRLHQSIVINIPETQNPHGPMPSGHSRTLSNGQGSNHTRDHGEGKEEISTELEEQRREICEGVRQEAEGAVIDVLQRYKSILVWFALILAKAEEILGTSYDFEHGNGPRFFVILPSHEHQWDAANILANHFRLFFLCECGEHTPTTGQESMGVPCLHLADADGYRVRNPVKLIEKFGPYLMVMLEMLKFGNQIAGYALPGLSAAGEIFPADALPPISLTLDRINKSIAYIETVACLNTSRPWDLTDYLADVNAAYGVSPDNNLFSHLEMEINKSRYSRMYRVRTIPTRADWVCKKHQPATLRRDYSEFECTLSIVGACLDYQRGKIVVAIASEAHGDQVCNVLTETPGAKHYDLELALDSNHSPTDLEKLQKLVGRATMRSVSVAVPPSSQSSVPSQQTNSARPSNQEGSHSDYASTSSRSSTRSDSMSSDQPLKMSLEKKLPDWVYTYYDQQPKQQYEDGRTRHAVESAPYMLPNDLPESDRLDGQHYIVRYIFQGNYNVKLDRTAPLKILDVATGTGIWAIEMAHEFPNAEIHGIDLSPIYPTPETSDKVVPPNCHFQLCNVLDGVPFPDNHFDYVYMRLLVYAFTPAQRKQVNLELLRVLKPSGHIQLVESDGLIYNPGPTTDMANALSLDTPMKKSVDPTEVQRLKPGLKRVGFAHVNSFCIALPVGDWGGLLGQLSRQNMHGLSSIWLRGELGRQPAELCEATLAEMDRECEQLQSFYRVWLVVGQKPALPTIMSPVLPLSPTTPTPSSRKEYRFT